MIDRLFVAGKFVLLKGSMNERTRRLWAGAEAEALGFGGVAAVAAATGMAISTVRKGRDELRAGPSSDGLVRVRRAGAGRPSLEEKDPGIKAALESLVDPTTRGDPESPLRWTCKSTRVLARELTKTGHPVSPQKVGALLRTSGFSLQGTSRVKEGKSHPDRNAQFEHINKLAKSFSARGVPVVSVDSKKKELVGEHGNAGREWQPKGKAVEVLTYDFPDPNVRKAIPYGIYDVSSNTGFVNVGIDHDTPNFAVGSIEKWWTTMGSKRYPAATELFLTADGGGSNSHKSRVWKAELQSLADRKHLTIHVSHFPPGTSKWNKIEHRLFSFITLNWRGRPLTTYETVVSLIAATTTAKGLRVRAQLDKGQYPCGAAVEDHVMQGLALTRAPFHGDWNYTLRPRTVQELARAQMLVEPKRKPSPLRRTLADWSKLVRAQIASGDNSNQFCKRNGINYQTFMQVRGGIAGSPYMRDADDWKRLVHQQVNSGLLSKTFCRQHGIEYTSFLYQRRKLLGPLNGGQSDH